MSEQPAITSVSESVHLSDETAVTDIEFTPDGRIYIFGASPQFLTLLRECGLDDPLTSSRITDADLSNDHSPGLTTSEELP